ncbi:helix-turn-helix domain-containing protein [Enterococcus sp. 2201sp1_2201st1_B8_2201SCRN_220225]|uniref:helix-turn-helix domain-containing protein n=1 Tax=unclassified Enterococcus TaxID=2608891 RepID=UPI0034A2A561
MILADKIIRERKKNGWTQEELAELMNVSRQSVSKWESAQSIPDINKVIRLSELFGVSTDYLFKDEMEEPEFVDSEEAANRRLTLAEAHQFLQIKERSAKIIAFATVLCILSPITLIVLSGIHSQNPARINETLVTGIGLFVLIVMVTCAVALFIYSGSQTGPYHFLDEEIFETEYGVTGMVKERKKAYGGQYNRNNIIATCLAILGVLPLILTAVAENELYMIFGLATLLVIEAVAVALFILNGIRWESMLKLLQEGEYSKERKLESHRNNTIAAIYWPVMLALYLGYSFLTNNWHISWVIWPVAGILYGAVIAMASLFRKK